jgi:hypothetical protein
MSLRRPGLLQSREPHARKKAFLWPQLACNLAACARMPVGGRRMNRAIVLILCLISAGAIAAYAHFFHERGEPAAVYVISQRTPEAKPKPPATTNIDPGDLAGLARALQRELKRVGCYSGEITGVWTTSSRMAMKAFTQRVNATLPIDAPDPVLLSLVQAHQDKACDTACPAGQTATEGGACVPDAALVKAAKPSTGETVPEAAKDKASAAPPAAGAAAALMLAKPGAGSPADAKEGGHPATAKPPPREGSSSEKKAPGERATTASGGPVPPEGMREKRPRRTDQTANPRPPKVVRDVLKALGF